MKQNVDRIRVEGTVGSLNVSGERLGSVCA
jgi:hypothetical protein